MTEKEADILARAANCDAKLRVFVAHIDTAIRRFCGCETSQIEFLDEVQAALSEVGPPYYTEPEVTP